MTARAARTIPYAIAAACAAGTVAVVVAGVLLPFDVSAPAEQASRPAARPTTAPRDGPTSQPGTADFADVMDVDLRPPLADAPPPPLAAPVPPAATVRLGGTICEPGHSFAVFRTASGKTAVKGVGQTVDGVGRITAITRESVTLDANGRPVTLAVPPPAPPLPAKPAVAPIGTILP